MNTIFLIVGCSGSGKTTVVKQLEQKYGLKSIPSYTTRPKRHDNETGHIFVTDEEFDNLTGFIGYTEFAGNRYGAVLDQVETNDLYIIDPKGVEFFRNIYKGHKKIRIIYLHTPAETAFDRMKLRAIADGWSEIKAGIEADKRTRNDETEFENFTHQLTDKDLIVINDKDTSLNEMVDYIYQYIISCEGE